VHLLTKILVVLVALLVAALVPLAAVSATNQATFKTKAADAEAKQKAAQTELSVANDAYNASVAAVQAKLSDLEARIRAVTMERDKEVQMRADKERDLERARIELADLKGQVAAMSANDSLQTKLIDAMRQDIEGARNQYLAAEKVRVPSASCRSSCRRSPRTRSARWPTCSATRPSMAPRPRAPARPPTARCPSSPTAR